MAPQGCIVTRNLLTPDTLAFKFTIQQQPGAGPLLAVGNPQLSFGQIRQSLYPKRISLSHQYRLESLAEIDHYHTVAKLFLHIGKVVFLPFRLEEMSRAQVAKVILEAADSTHASQIAEDGQR